MALKLMYITNQPSVAKIAESTGVDRIFIDMEYIGKADRQGGMDTVQSHHTVEDVENIRNVITKSEILVRCNPIHENSKSEIDAVVNSGADIIMLPFFKTVKEVKSFIENVGGRVKTMLLLETPEAVECIDEILSLHGIDEIHIGLNDLSLGYGMKFMFELLADGTVEKLCRKFREKGIPYGFGGIARLGEGLLPAERVIMEHYRLGSTKSILSRSFCNTQIMTDISEIEATFVENMAKLRAYEKTLEAKTDEEFEANRREVINRVETITKIIKERN